MTFEDQFELGRPALFSIFRGTNPQIKSKLSTKLLMKSSFLLLLHKYQYILDLNLLEKAHNVCCSYL